MLIDQAIIHLISGKGGDGVIHFRREKYVPFGGPDGGDGGRGGDVLLSVNPKLNTLSSFRQKTRYKAADGISGGKQNMTGKSGEDLIIEVPPGTLVYDSKSGKLLGDLVQPSDTLLIVKGGRGGRGNSHFATSRNQTPRIAEHGEPSQEREIRLELKLIADVGIIGPPNAGKSTLLAAVTKANPKIAAYPFTTLEPHLGVAELDEENTLILADIPGLIEGAHQGVGLGHDFLRHIERTRVLIHLLDGFSDHPAEDYIQINRELALFDPNLAQKPQVVAINKIDVPEVLERVDEIRKKLKKDCSIQEIYAISALAKTNLQDLLYRVVQLLKEQPPEQARKELPVYRLEAEPRDYEIIRERGGWRVKGIYIERLVAMTYWEHHQSIRRFQRIFKSLGIEDALREAGVQPGDTVYIGEYELEWSD